MPEYEIRIFQANNGYIVTLPDSDVGRHRFIFRTWAEVTAKIASYLESEKPKHLTN